MQRREFLRLSLMTALVGASAKSALADGIRQLRVGYQKNGVPVVARQQSVLERKLAPRGIDVRWSEFASGPPMMEAMNAGSIDLGQVGDTPPIFAQAADAAVVYVAGQPITNGQGILVKRDSPIRALSDLKGKRIGLARGSSAHNVTLIALEKAGLSPSDVTFVYLQPPDASAAFIRDSIDAWAIWDPYFAIGETHGGRILVNAGDIAKTNSFYIADRDFATRDPLLLHEVMDAFAETARWAEANREKVARALADVTGVEFDIQIIAANRSSFAVGKLTDDIIATQQAVADRFHRLGLIPKPIAVREAVWAGALA